ncbi:MAG TPA: sugar transferase, partial [Candidatus Baltobacteraceae bacterium]
HKPYDTYIVVETVVGNAYPDSAPMQRPRLYSSLWSAALVLLDMLMFSLSLFVAIKVAQHLWDPHITVGRVALTALLSIVAWLGFFYRWGLYRVSFAISIKDEFYYTVTALCMGVAPILLLFTIVPSISSSRVEILLSLVFAIAAVGGGRAIAHSLYDHAKKHNPRRIAIVGSPARIAAAAGSLNIVEGSRVLMIEVADIDASMERGTFKPGAEFKEVGWFQAALNWKCDTLIVTEMLSPDVLPYILEIAARNEIRLAIAPPRIRAQAYSLTLQTDGQQALIIPNQLRACRPSARLLKRILDLTVASTALIILAPVMIAVALAILIDSGRPIFYRQERVGRGGTTFSIFKFRSMRVDAEAQTGPTWTRLGDTRTTRVGAFLRRTSLDELPQFFNVLLGNMSIVGPRPERPIFVERFSMKMPRYHERHLVRPGITGWSHVHMPRNCDISRAGERLAYDLFYLENWGLLMDVSVLFKTAVEFLFQRAG